MPTIGDLRLVRGIDEITFRRLSPFITVTPSVRVNINTAPPEVLMAVVPALQESPSSLKSILEERVNRPGEGVFSLRLRGVVSWLLALGPEVGLVCWAGQVDRVPKT